MQAGAVAGCRRSVLKRCSPVLLGLMLLGGCGGEAARTPVPVHPDTPVFRSVEPQPVRLMGAFQSYDDEASLRKQLAEAGFAVERKLLTKTPSGRYPPRDMTTLTVRDFRHLGELGTLSLELFNNRLMEADFRPEDAAAYAKALHRSTPNLPRGSTGTSEVVQGPLRIYSNVDLAKSRVGGNLGTDALVLWQDLRLTAQRDAWDTRFGSIPEPVNSR